MCDEFSFSLREGMEPLPYNVNFTYCLHLIHRKRSPFPSRGRLWVGAEGKACGMDKSIPYNLYFTYYLHRRERIYPFRLHFPSDRTIFRIPFPAIQPHRTLTQLRNFMYSVAVSRPRLLNRRCYLQGIERSSDRTTY